jgi:hypothetical protein
MLFWSEEEGKDGWYLVLRLTNAVENNLKVIFFSNAGKPLKDGQANPKYIRKRKVLNNSKFNSLDTHYILLNKKLICWIMPIIKMFANI